MVIPAFTFTYDWAGVINGGIDIAVAWLPLIMPVFWLLVAFAVVGFVLGWLVRFVYREHGSHQAMLQADVMTARRWEWEDMRAHWADHEDDGPGMF